MNKDNILLQNNIEKIRKSFSNKIKIHLSLKDKTWRNGFVKEVLGDVFSFEDLENGLESFFYLEVYNVEPFMKEEK